MNDIHTFRSFEGLGGQSVESLQWGVTQFLPAVGKAWPLISTGVKAGSKPSELWKAIEEPGELLAQALDSCPLIGQKPKAGGTATLAALPDADRTAMIRGMRTEFTAHATGFGVEGEVILGLLGGVVRSIGMGQSPAQVAFGLVMSIIGEIAKQHLRDQTKQQADETGRLQPAPPAKQPAPAIEQQDKGSSLTQ